MIDLITDNVEIAGTGVRIRILPLGELAALITGLGIYSAWIEKQDSMSFPEIIRQIKYLKKFIKNSIKKATNLKRPKLKHFFLVDLILSINLGTALETSNIKSSNDEIYRLIDLLAAEYGWTDSYILSHISLDKARKFAGIILERREKQHALHVLGNAHAFHSPDGQYLKSMTGILSGKKRRRIFNVQEYLNDLKKEQKNV